MGSWKEEFKGFNAIVHKWYEQYDKFMSNSVTTISEKSMIQYIALTFFDDSSRLTLIADGHSDDKILPYQKTMPQMGGGKSWREFTVRELEARVGVHLYLLEDPIMGKAHAKLALIYKKYHDVLRKLYIVAFNSIDRQKNDQLAKIGLIKLLSTIDSFLRVGMEVLQVLRIQKNIQKTNRS